MSSGGGAVFDFVHQPTSPAATLFAAVIVLPRQIPVPVHALFAVLALNIALTVALSAGKVATRRLVVVIYAVGMAGARFALGKVEESETAGVASASVCLRRAFRISLAIALARNLVANVRFGAVQIALAWRTVATGGVFVVSVFALVARDARIAAFALALANDRVARF